MLPLCDLRKNDSKCSIMQKNSKYIMSTSVLQELESLINIFEKETEYLSQWVKDCYSQYPLQSIINIRKLIARPEENNPPIQQVIDSGVIPQIIKLLTQNNYNFDMFISGYSRQFNFEYIIHSDIINYIRNICKLYCIDGKLQSEVRWILTNICSFTDDQTQYIVNQGAIPILIDGLKDTSSIEIKSNSISALANITGTLEFINIVLEHGTLDPVMNIIKNTNLKTQNKIEIELLQDIARLLNNLCRDKIPNWKYVKLLIPMLTMLFRAQDEETLSLALWGISKLLQSHDENLLERRHIDAVLNNEYLSQIIALLRHKSESIRRPALRICSNISYTDYSNSDMRQLTDLHLLSALNNLFSDSDLIKAECCCLISNLCVTEEQIESVIKTNLFPKIINSLKNDEYSVAIEALWAVNNAAMNGYDHDIQYLIDDGVISALFGWFNKTKTTSKQWKVALETIKFVINAAQIVKCSDNDDKGYKYYVEKCDTMYDLNEIFCQQTMGCDVIITEIWNKIESIVETHCEGINPIIIGGQYKSTSINDMIKNLEKQMRCLMYLKNMGWTDIKPNTTYYLYIE
eukprot:129326_1